MLQTGKFYKLTASVRAWKPKEDVVTSSTNMGAIRPDFRSGEQHYQQMFDMGDMWGAGSFKEVQLTAGTRLKLISSRPQDYFRFELMDEGADKGYQVDISTADCPPGTFIDEDGKAVDIGVNSGLRQVPSGAQPSAPPKPNEVEPQPEWKEAERLAGQ